MLQSARSSLNTSVSFAGAFSACAGLVLIGGCVDEDEVIPILHGHEVEFCQPMPGFFDWLAVGGYADSVWTVVDCSNGRAASFGLSGNFDEVPEPYAKLAALRQLHSAPTGSTSLAGLVTEMATAGVDVEVRDEAFEQDYLDYHCPARVLTEGCIGNDGIGK